MWNFLKIFVRSDIDRHASRIVVKKKFGKKKQSLSVEVLEDRTVLNGTLIGDLVVFGDSLNDVGNLWLASGGAFPPNELYAQGCFSNGPLWVETLAEYLGEPAVQPSLMGGLNYAFAGARATGESPYGVPDVTQQVGLHLFTRGHEVDSSDLFAFWAGPNDFFFTALVTGVPVDPTEPVAALTASMESLITAGGSRFLIANMPLLGQTPFFQDQLEAGFIDQNAINQINAWSLGFNFVLSLQMQHLRDTYGATIAEVDVAHLLQQASQPNNPYGFTNWTDAVGPYDLQGHVVSINPGVNPDEYVFFDSVHPSTKAHQVVGLHAAASVFTALGVHSFTVTNTSDAVDPLDGGRSLREVLNLANTMPGHQTITFDLGLGNQQITLGGQHLAITDDVDIEGPGVNVLTLSGDDSSRLFSVEAGVFASISDMTLRHGVADHGGAIANTGNLTLERMILSDNRAVNPGGVSLGGAIYNGDGATLNLYQSLLINNVAMGGMVNAGGAIANAGTGTVANIWNSVILNNHAIGGELALGGGIANLDGAALKVVASTIALNSARGGDYLPDGTGGDALGGGIYSGDHTTLDLDHCLILGNLAEGGSGNRKALNGQGLGGGVYLAPTSDAEKESTLILLNFASTRANNVSGKFSR